MPADAENALGGEWRRGPGADLFRAAEAVLGPLPVVAEDLGLITPEVEELRDELGFPGMAVLQFGFSGVPSNPHRPKNHREQQVLYTGTHDHDTLLGWWESATEEQQAEAGIPGVEPHWELIDLALSSRAAVAIVQAQDVLGLDSEARLNRPGTADGNWSWRLEPGQLTTAHAARLRGLTERHGRLAPG